MGYEEILKRHEEEASTFSKGKLYFIFASTESELIEELDKRGLAPSDVKSIGGGGYIKKEYVKDFQDLLTRHSKEKKEYTLNNTIPLSLLKFSPLLLGAAKPIHEVKYWRVNPLD